MKKKLMIVCVASVLSALTGWTQQSAPAFTLPDVYGVTHNLSQYAGKIVVLEWTNYDCPFVRKFYGTGAMQAMQKQFANKGVVWLSICSSAPGKQGNFSPDE